jgi:4-hydroxybenzoate polyprenyltransferase
MLVSSDGGVVAALRILLDVAAFRLKKLEMANLAAAVAVMVALRLPLGELGGRAGFAALLNLLVYLNNDWFDVEQDLSSRRDDRKTSFLRQHLRAALGAQIGLGAVLIAWALAWKPELLVSFVAGAGICVWYSARLKRVPFADVAAMTAWGAAMPLAGVPLQSALGWRLLGQLALFSTCFELIQVIRDHDEDQKASVRTTAVALGARATLWVARGFMFAAALYAMLALQRWAGLVLLVAPLVPFDARDVGRYWTRVRLVFGGAWLGIVGWIYWTGSAAGLVV